MDTCERRWNLLLSLASGLKTRQQILEEFDRQAPDDRGLTGSTLPGDVKALRAAGIGFRPLTRNQSLRALRCGLHLGRGWYPRHQ